MNRCGYTAYSKWLLKQHQLSVHDLPESIFRCEFPGCTCRSTSQEYLNAHKPKHELSVEKQRPHICTFEGCGFRAARKSNLDKHICAKHSKLRTRDFPCPLCPGRFYTATQLRHHITIHVREKQYKCSYCEFVTHSQESLLGHRKNIHDKSARKVSCSFPGCNYSTADSFRLKRHKLTHETDPEVKYPFLCSIPGCSYRSSTTFGLRSHMSWRHNPNHSRKFSCTLCESAFYAKSSLTRHINGVHVKEQTYRCESELAHSSSGVTEDHGNKQATEVIQGSASDYTPLALAEKNSISQYGGSSSKLAHSGLHQVAVVIMERIQLELM